MMFVPPIIAMFLFWVGVFATIEVLRSLKVDQVLLPLVIEGEEFASVTAVEGWRVRASWEAQMPSCDGPPVKLLKREPWGLQ